MREWGRPRFFASGRGAQLRAYRVRVTAGSKPGVPEGVYVAVRLEEPGVAAMRMLLGPMSEDKSQEMLDHATPQGLIELMQEGMAKGMPAGAAGPSDTLH